MLRKTLLIAALAAAWPGCAAEREEPQADPAAALDEIRGPLESLGYVNLVPADDERRTGVTRWDREAAWPGLNLFNSRDESVARLIGMDGRELHRFASDARGTTHRLFHERLPSWVPPYLDGWNHVELLEGGDLLVIGSHHMLLRLDWNSRIRWQLDIAAHHDLSVAPDGRIHVLTDAVRTLDLGGEPVTFQDNEIAVVSPEGEVERRISLMDAFLADPAWEALLRAKFAAIRRVRAATIEALQASIRSGDEEASHVLRLYASRTDRSVPEEERGIRAVLFHERAEDLLHSNSIQVLERDRPGLWRAGDLLLCIRELDRIAVLDHESGRLVWSWGADELEGPHHATELADGTILVFDNGAERGWSRVLRLDPDTGGIVWQYRADPPSDFFSQMRGGCEPLPNGNLLISETDRGRAFEITPEGEIVWEYHNEVLKEVDGEVMRGAIYRMTRIDASAVEPLLRPAAPDAAPAAN